jgi:hypothetical protein
MIERTEQRIGLKPRRIAADTAYGTGKLLGWQVGAGIAPQIPVWDKSTREDGTFSRSDFTFDRERNVYVCPAGKFLRPRAMSATITPFVTSRLSEIAMHAHSNRNAVRECSFARSHATSTRMRAI